MFGKEPSTTTQCTPEHLLKEKASRRFLLLVTMQYDVVITSKILQKQVWFLYEDKSGGRLLAFSILGTKSSSFCCVILSQISH
ncbi:hypothetical protein ACE6H2_013048 [Prunus campanulata]